MTNYMAGIAVFCGALRGKYNVRMQARLFGLYAVYFGMQVFSNPVRQEKTGGRLYR